MSQDDKPLRGHTTPLIHWDDHDYMRSIDKSLDEYANSTPVVKLNNSLNSEPIEQLPYNTNFTIQLPQGVDFSSTPDVVEVTYTEYPSVHQTMKMWHDSVINIPSRTTLDPFKVEDYVLTKNLMPVWFRPRIPSKVNGRKGTRKGWKKRNPPRWLYLDLDRVQWFLPETLL